MKKTLLAAALMAGFAGIAQAETSVTLYGVVDGGVGYQKTKNNNFQNTRTGMIDGVQYGNRWGLRGTEDLGDGLRAVFTLESGFNLGSGTQAQGTKKGEYDRLFGRQATLGLAGDSWGQLDFGRQTNISSKYLGEASPFAYSYLQANLGAAMSAANTARYDNMVMYQTPNFSGFQFGIGYSFNVNGDQDGVDKNRVTGAKTKTDKHAVTTGLRYNNGPIGAGLTYEQFKSRNADQANVKAWGVAFSYDFEVAKIHLGGGQTRDGMFAMQGYDSAAQLTDSNGDNVLGSYTGAKGLRVNSYMAGVSAPVGEGKVMASWMMADLSKLPTVLRNDGISKKKQNTYSLGYVHPLSKRTDVYAIGSYAKNVNFVKSQKATLAGVGLSHRF